jgi:hypothetical protein
MREAIGGAFLLKMMFTFIVIYNSLLAIAINYAIAFRVKHQIINIIERYEGCTGAGDRIDSYVRSIGYYRAASPTGQTYSIVPQMVGELNERGTYYYVTTYIQFDFPIIRDWGVAGGVLSIPIVGESKVLHGIWETPDACQNIIR